MARSIDRRRGSGAAPARPPADPARAEAVRAISTQLASERGPLLPILHAVVEDFGYIHDDDIPVIADALNLSRADVHGVVSFYHDFRRTPPAAHQVQICRGEACQSVGAESLYAATRAAVADRPDIEVHEVFCLGNCALGPSGVINGQLRGLLTAEHVASSLSGAGS